MWGKRRKRGGRLSRQLALGLLEDAMARVEQPEEPEQGERAAVPYPEGAPATEYETALPGVRAGLRAASVPVDNSAGPDPKAPKVPRSPAVPPDVAEIPPQSQPPAQRSEDRSRHRSFD